MESSAGTCGVCGNGKVFSSASFGSGNARVRWSMWFCGHTTRVPVGADDLGGELVETLAPAKAEAVEATS